MISPSTTPVRRKPRKDMTANEDFPMTTPPRPNLPARSSMRSASTAPERKEVSRVDAAQPIPISRRAVPAEDGLDHHDVSWLWS